MIEIGLSLPRVRIDENKSLDFKGRALNLDICQRARADFKTDFSGSKHRQNDQDCTLVHY